MPKYIEINCKSACNKIVSSFLPYHYDLNVYRGCFHKCVYCFAQYSPKFATLLDKKRYQKVIFPTVKFFLMSKKYEIFLYA